MSKAQRAEAQGKYETSPERIAVISETLDAIYDAGGYDTFDGFYDEQSLRNLAAHLRVPYVQLLLTCAGTTGLTEEDVTEYNNWRAACAKGGAR